MMRAAAVAVLLTLACTGCGQKGPLRAPDPPPPAGEPAGHAPDRDDSRGR